MSSFSVFIAKRYLFSHKTHNVINLISALSITGVAVGAMALIVILSVFNGLDGLVKSLFSSFDPDIKITAAKGKTFIPDTEDFYKVMDNPGIWYYTEVLEENALLHYGDKQKIATVKGVSSDFIKMSGIDSMMVDGNFVLRKGANNFTVVGGGVALYLQLGLSLQKSIKVYVPKRGEINSLNPEDAFNTLSIMPKGVFSIQQDFDNKYIITPIEFTRKLLDYSDEVSSLDFKFINGLITNEKETIIDEIKATLGDKYIVKNRYEQNSLLYKTMQSEKWAIFAILSFILIIASFNAVASITMLIIDKKDDINILQSMGANNKTIRKIFLYQGWMISIIGAFSGLLFGALICWLQMQFGFVQFPNSGAFIISAYPVKMQLLDFLSVFVIVFIIGFIAAWLPVRFISRIHLVD